MVGTLEAWTDPAPTTRLCWRHEGRVRASTIATEQKQKHCKDAYSSYARCKNACGMFDSEGIEERNATRESRQQ